MCLYSVQTWDNIYLVLKEEFQLTYVEVLARKLKKSCSGIRSARNSRFGATDYRRGGRGGGGGVRNSTGYTGGAPHGNGTAAVSGGMGTFSASNHFAAGPRGGGAPPFG